MVSGQSQYLSIWKVDIFVESERNFQFDHLKDILLESINENKKVPIIWMENK